MAEANQEDSPSVRLYLKNGVEIFSGWYDDDDPDRQPAGDYMSAYFANGAELHIEWHQIADPLTGRKALSDFLIRCERGS